MGNYGWVLKNQSALKPEGKGQQVLVGECGHIFDFMRSIRTFFWPSLNSVSELMDDKNSLFRCRAQQWPGRGGVTEIFWF